VKVLLIEHDADFARYVSEMLGQAAELNADIRCVPDLHTGLAVLGAEEFEVVILDLYVHDGAGVANIPLVHGVAPQVPIVCLGDCEDESVSLDVVHEGAQDYLARGQLTPSLIERSIRYAVERYHLDRTLLIAEQKYHSVFDNLVEGIFRTTPDGRYLMANAALARINGYSSPEEMMEGVTNIAQTLYVQPGRRDEFIRIMQEHDTITGFESQVYRKDRSVIWISENCRSVRDEQGKLLYYEGTVEDITQRQHAEEKLRNSEALYQSLVETLPQFIFRKDLEGHFTFANQQFCKMLGHPLETILGKKDADFFPPEMAKKFQADDQRVLDTGKPYETVEENQPPGRGKIYVQVVKTPLYDAAGKVIGLQGIFWDITQQRLAEERIRRANGLLAQSRRELRTKNAQMEDDLKMAREIQLTMLPQQFPAFPRPDNGSVSAFEFTHRYLPTGSVGGDFFSVSALSKTEAAVFICDVAGHGVRSALVTAMIRALVEEVKPPPTNPGQFLSRVNSDLCSILKNTGTPLLTTAISLVANWKTGKMWIANAGHPRPLHVQRATGQVSVLGDASVKRQPALGLFENTLYQSSPVQIAPNDLIMLFTDGLIDVEGAERQLYSQSKLLESVQRRLQLPAPKLFDELIEEVRAFSNGHGFLDDLCLVGIDVL